MTDQKTLPTEEKILPVDQFPFQTTRSFGVELECYLPAHLVMGDEAQFERGSAHRGVEITGAPVTANGKTWKAEDDGSLRGWAPAGYEQVEVVSPVLHGEEGLIDTLAMVDYMHEVRVHTNGQCGVHIHVDCSDLTVKDRQKLVKLFKSYERAFYSLNGLQTRFRLLSSYCAHSKKWLTDNPEEIDSSRYTHKRYQSLNWQAYQRQGTFEFRLFSGELIHEPGLLLSAIMLCVAFVDAVKAGTLSPTSSKKADFQLFRLFQHIGLMGAIEAEWPMLEETARKGQTALDDIL